MFYPLELPRPRKALYGEYGKKLGQIRAQHEPQGSAGKLWRLLLPYLKEYTATSSVHGIRYLADPKLKYFERIIWLLILVATSIGASIVYVDLSELYQSMRIQTTIKNTMYPIFAAPFPAVGICPRNRINWIKLENEAPYHFLGPNISAAEKELFVRFFTSAADSHLTRLTEMSSFFNNAPLAANLTLLDVLDVATVIEYVLLKCSDFFSACLWRGNPQNCCEIFELQFTESGSCWVFNSLISPARRQKEKDNKYYPRRTPQYGEGSGLDVFLRLRNSSLIRPNKRGVYVMIKQPQQWSDVVRHVPHGAQTQISMVPRITTTDQRTRALTPRARRCIFPDEVTHPQYKNLPGFEYWVGNCRSKCHQEHVINLCKCSPSVFFPVTDKDNFTVCRPSDFKCLHDNRLTFSVERHPQEDEYVDNLYKESMICNCFISCTQLIFDRVFSSSTLDNNDTHTELGTIRLDIFYQSGWFIQYHTNMRFTFVELLASFGGIIGLFLGASLLSAFELVYFFTIGLYLYLHGERKLSFQPRPLQPAVITIPFGQRKITPAKYIR
ncbi:pickpocket protein 19 [Drosophila persimilis]|uniref:pickpocket protein 19 n=1 Tax=Drosophila persimilis TaxID=7234 RepID=UPI000F0875CA|nr:pickpocket protein 19 [Drosophila persimilis]